MNKKGLLLLNLGTPDSSDAKDVRRYLHEFLNDPLVVDLPTIVRWPLVNLLITPFRYKKSAENYAKIWRIDGSPLLLNTLALAEGVKAELDASFKVEVGMRYGNPSIEEAIKKLQPIESLFVLPLFPQYSRAATGSALQKTTSLLLKSKQYKFHSLDYFYAENCFINSYVEHIKNYLQNIDFEVLLFSYHGLPQRNIQKTCQTVCDVHAVCPTITKQNEHCYRAQCFSTTALIAAELNLSSHQFLTGFQSRLGRAPWIKPYIDKALPELIEKGIRKIAITCPSFVADCLETLEEVNIRLRDQWMSLGGESFHFIPSLNANPKWVKELTKLIYKLVDQKMS